MSRYGNWAIAGLTVILVATLSGCGQTVTSSGGNTSDSNGISNQATNTTTNLTSGNLANEATNTIMNSSSQTGNTVTNPASNVTTTPPTSAKAPQVTFQKQTVTIEPNVSVSFQVPTGWTRQDAGAGDTSGTNWVNPTNSNEWVQLKSSGNVGALENTKGQYDVTSYINTQGVTWTSVSANKLSGEFTIPVGAINNTVEGYGYAMVITKPNPLGVTLESAAPQDIAQSIVQNVSIQTQAASLTQ